MTASTPISKGIGQAGPGRAFLIGGSFVALALSSFYLSMHQNKKRQVEAGMNPHFEQIMTHVSKKPDVNEDLKPLRSYSSDIPPALPGKDHYSGHSTRANWKNTPSYAEHGDAARLMQPTPQREGSNGRAYTKSPDYVKNYGKTERSEPVSRAM